VATSALIWSRGIVDFLRQPGDPMMDRRTFVGSMVSLAGTSLLVHAQPAGKVWRIGYIGTAPVTTPELARLWDAFLETMQKFGYVEGQDLSIELRYSEGNIERFPALATELVRLDVDVIVVGSAPGARAAKEATATIPIVMSGTSDPVGAGLVASLAHPGGNITGIADYQVDLIPKRLELLKMVSPKVTRVANLFGNFGGFDAAKLARVNAEQDADLSILRPRRRAAPLSRISVAAVVPRGVHAAGASPQGQVSRSS